MDYDHVKKQLGYGIQTESKDNAIKAIEQLAARVRELEEERRKVIEALDGYHFSGLPVSYSVKELVSGYKDRNQAAATFMSQLNETEQQLAASQAYAEQLRGVLTECQGFFDPEEGTSHNFRKLTIRDIEKPSHSHATLARSMLTLRRR